MESHEPLEVPLSYAESTITFLPRDPDWAYVFWEILPDDASRAKQKLGEIGPTAKLVLRQYHSSNGRRGRPRKNFYDIDVDEWIGGRYVLLGNPGSIHSIAIGYRSEMEVFVAIARSMPSRTPRREAGHLSPTYARVHYIPSELGRPLRVDTLNSDHESREEEAR